MRVTNWSFTGDANAPQSYTIGFQDGGSTKSRMITRRHRTGDVSNTVTYGESQTRLDFICSLRQTSLTSYYSGRIPKQKLMQSLINWKLEFERERLDCCVCRRR